jgi:hypothetical protein
MASSVATGKLRMRACAIRAIMTRSGPYGHRQIARGEMRCGFVEGDICFGGLSPALGDLLLAMALVRRP